MTARQLEVNEQLCPAFGGNGVTGDPYDRQSPQCRTCHGFGTIVDEMARP